MQKLNLYNNTQSINQNQDIYQSFNNFIFSEDRNLFNKLYSRIKFYEMVKDLNGDIVECGVFKGSGLLSWLKILDMNEPNSIKKVIGFDFFDNSFVDNLQGIDKTTMAEVFSRCETKTDDISINSIENTILQSGFLPEKFTLVKGDISQTTKEFVKNKPGFRISILYLDLDLYEPTYDTLVNLWDYIVYGGIVVFDEYAYHNWSESKAADQFIKEKKISLISTKVKAPTAYFIKTIN
jgi:hypothetical protein